MDIDNLFKNIKTKLLSNAIIQNVKIEDKTYLHAKHVSNEKKKFHIDSILNSNANLNAYANAHANSMANAISMPKWFQS